MGLLLPGTAARQPNHYPLESTAGLRLRNVVAEAATLQGKKGLRVTGSEEAQRRLQTMTPDEVTRFPQLAAIDGLEFANGVIEAEIAGAPAPGAGEQPVALSELPSASRITGSPTTRSIFVPQMVAPTIKSDGIMRFSTFHTLNGRGSGFARRPHPSMNRT